MSDKDYIGILDTNDPKEIEVMEYALFGKETVDQWIETKKINEKNDSPKEKLKTA